MIVAAAIRHNGVIYTGDRHCNIIKYMVYGLKIKPPIKNKEQGFVDNKNHFMSREVAFLHAIGCDQVRENGLIGSVLTSEDLW